MPKFSTHESVSLEKKPDLPVKPVETKSEDIDDVYEIRNCVRWIQSNNFKKVCLQFPDYLLPDSTEVILRLQSILKQTLYIIGDSSFESCCIDYIAAEHINADAIIHFGPICFSRTSANIPFINIYEKKGVNVQSFKNLICDTFQDPSVELTILVDSPFIHRIDDMLLAFQCCPNVTVRPIDEHPLVVAKNTIIVFVGKHERKLINVDFSFEPKVLYYYFDGDLKKFSTDPVILRRRNYLIEKIKDSKTVGIVIGTLCVRNYLKIIERLKQLIEKSGKKYYLISVGKPTVAKLANFVEIDIYVIITCSLSTIYDSRDFYRPIVTPFDIEIALNTNRNQNIKFSFDYNTYLGEEDGDEQLEVAASQEGDVSLLTNRIRPMGLEEDVAATASGASDPTGSEVAIKSEGTVAESTHYGAGFLAQRSWTGLEQNLGQTEAELAQEGRSGTAMKYKNEGS